jgi:hypothetical protein
MSAGASALLGKGCEMTLNEGLPVPPRTMSGDTSYAVQEARAARRRRSVLKGVVLMTVVHVATDKRTLAAAVVAVVALAAAARLASEGGNPLDWYLSLSRGKGDAAP